MQNELAAPEMRLVVRPSVGGRVIQSLGGADGPFPSRCDTIELAEGMAEATRESGAVED